MTASVRPLALYKFAQGRGSAPDREDIWHLVDRACTAELPLSLSRMKANPEVCIVTVVGVLWHLKRSQCLRLMNRKKVNDKAKSGSHTIPSG